MVHPTRRSLAGALPLAAAGLALPMVGRAAAAEFTYKFGVDLPTAHPTSVWAQKAADTIRERTGGRLEIRVFSNGALGSSTEMTSQLRSGALEFLSQSGPVLSQLVPAAALNSVGFAFSTEADVFRALDGELGAYIRSQIVKAGLVVMDRIWSLGFRQITTSTIPVTGPADLKGIKIRVPPGNIFVTLFNALGAGPASINYSELFSALQNRVVDAQENPVGVIFAGKIYEAQKFLSITNHMWAGYWFLANRRAFEALPADIRAIASEVINQCALEQRAQLAREDTDYVKQLGDKGLKTNNTKADDFRAALARVNYYQDARNRFGEQPWALLEQFTGHLG